MKSSALRLAVPILLVAVWLWVVSQHLVRPIFVPAPADLWKSLQGLMPGLPAALPASVLMTLTGLLIGTAAGVITGLVMAYSRVARDLFGGLVAFVAPIPIFALIPLFVLWFGIGRMPQIGIIMIGTWVIICVMTMEAIKNVLPVHIRAALIFGADRRTIYLTVVVPSILPNMLGAIRAAAAASWGLDVAAEFIGAQTGLGVMIIARQQYLDTASMLVLIAIYSVLAIVLDRIILRLERPFTAWTSRHGNLGAAGKLMGME
jgi:ABC-type nitrate/sulfonate/bicarbonate transport system permease component